MSAAGFRAREWPQWKTLADRHAKLAKGLDELGDAFDKDFEVPLPDTYSRPDVSPFPSWSQLDVGFAPKGNEEARQALITMLKRPA